MVRSGSQTEYNVNKDCYNKLEFKPCNTRALKLTAKLQKGEAGGIIEWKVNEPIL
jgi:hypothetical protein